MQIIRGLAGLLAGSLPAGALAAQASAPPTTVAAGTANSDTRSFTPADFTRYSPKTALDMVRQLPGFAIIESDVNNRGLGQASGNILLNGERLSAKNVDAATLLARIDAASVVRIELRDGATLDIPGLTGQIANIVYRASDWSGTWEWQPEVRRRIDPNLFRGEVAINGRSGKNEITASLSSTGFRNGHWGLERRTDPAGNLILTRDHFGRFYADVPKLTASLSRRADNGNLLNLNGSAQLYLYEQRVTGDVIGPGTARSEEEFFQTEREWNAELGGDYEFALGRGRLKLIGLQRLEHSPYVNRFITDYDDPALATRGDRFVQTVDETESIARAEYRWKSGAADWQVSLEGAFNKLDSKAGFAVLDAAGEFQPVPLLGATAKVIEQRGELIVTHGRPFGPRVTGQINLGAEYSQLKVTGPDILTRNQGYFRPKGSVSLSWRVNDRLTINAKAERRVDQLSFYDFLASVDLVNDTDRAENPTLVPPQRWRAEIDFTQSLGKYGSIKPYFAIARVDDIVESIPISPTREARGNIPGTNIFRTTLTGTLQLAPFGWNGAKIDLYGDYARPTTKDPLTGERRYLSNYQRYYWSIDLRHDVPSTEWAWGAKLDRNKNYGNYLLTQYRLANTTAPYFSLFVENKDLAGLTVRATVYNLLNVKDRFERTVYVNRRDGPAAFFEERERGFGRFLNLIVQGKF